MNFVEHNRHFLSIYFLVDPFILPYWFYSIVLQKTYVIYQFKCSLGDCISKNFNIYILV